MFLIPPKSLPSSLPSGSCSPQGYHFVIGYVGMLFVFKTQSRDGLTELNPIANRVLKGRIVFLHDVDHLTTIQRLNGLTFVWLTETGNEHFAKVLLLHEILIQLLNTGYLIIVKPVRSMLLFHFIDHLRIKLSVVDLTSIVNQLTIWNQKADVSTATSRILQRMAIVSGSHERSESRTILLSFASKVQKLTLFRINFCKCISKKVL